MKGYLLYASIYMIFLKWQNDSVKEQDSCWWKYVTKKDSWCVDFATMTSYSAGTRFIAEGRIYEVVTDITSTNYPPFETGWFKELSYGGGIIKYIGNDFKELEKILN